MNGEGLQSSRHAVAVAPRVAAAGHDAGRGIDRDALHAAYLHGPVGTGHDGVAALAQGALHVGWQAPLEQHVAPVGQAAARRLDRLLQRQAEIDVLHEGLRLGLQDAVAARRAERHHRLVVLGHDRGCDADRHEVAVLPSIGAAGRDVGPVEEVVEADSGARHHDARAEHAAQTLGYADDVAVAVGDRERGGVAVAGPVFWWRRPLLGRAGYRLAVARPRAQAFDVAVRQEFGELLRRGHAVGDAHAGRQPDGAQHGVDVIDAVALHLAEVEAFEDAQGYQVLERLAGRRRHMDRAAAIGHRHRIDPLGLEVGEVVHGEAAAQLGQAFDHLLAQRAAVQQAGALVAQRLERVGEVWLLQHGTELRPAAGQALEVVARPFGIERRLPAQLAADAADLLDVELNQAEAVARDTDRRREQLG